MPGRKAVHARTGRGYKRLLYIVNFPMLLVGIAVGAGLLVYSARGSSDPSLPDVSVVIRPRVDPLR